MPACGSPVALWLPVTKRLLIVDDEISILFALKRYFIRQGYAVDCARELEEAEALAAHTIYDLVIADLSLSGAGSAEGLEIIRFVRRHNHHARSIVLTAYGTPHVEREARRRGANAFLAKPQQVGNIAQLAKRLMEGEL